MSEAGDNSAPDHAGVAFHPPVMLGLSLLAGFALRALRPLAFVPEQAASLLGPVVVVASFALFFWAAATLRRGGASIPTNEPTAVIVTDGPYRFSRNPIYVAMIALLVGVGLWSNSLWFLALAALDVILLTWGVILREENYLERKFVAGYSSYKARVRRWL